MGVRDAKVQVYQCDECGEESVDLYGDGVHGIHLTWFEVHSLGGSGGTLWTCKEACAVKAIKKRHAIEQTKEDEARNRQGTVPRLDN